MDKIIKTSDAVDIVAKHSALYGDGEVNTDEGEALLYNIMSEIMNLSSAQPELPPYVAEIEKEYRKAVKAPYIRNPLAKALHEVWKKHDREDVSRNEIHSNF